MKNQHDMIRKVLIIIASIAIVLSTIASIAYRACNPNLSVLGQFIEFPAPVLVIAISFVLIRVSNEIIRD